MPTRPDPDFMSEMEALESAYLQSSIGLGRSGYHGGEARWSEERRPLVEAVHRDGDFLDVGCADGRLAADVVTWAAEAGHRIVPHGVDLGPSLVSLARSRHRSRGPNFVVADAWSWEPARRWTFVYSLLDLSPADLRCQWLRRLFGWVEPGGRLIIGSYGSASRQELPEPVADVVRRCGFHVAGTSSGGDGPVTRFAWVERVLRSA